MPNSGLIVRRSIRHEVVLPARVRVAPEHAMTVRFAKGVTDSDGWIGCSLIDFAASGVGIITEVLLPRGAAIELELPDGGAPDTPAFRARCRVMRVQMTDRRPAYLVGLAFTDQSEATMKSIETLLDRLEGSEPPC